MSEHDEKWLLSRGWTKTKGFKIDSELMDDIFDGRGEVFVPSIEDIDAIEECEYYEKEEFATDDIDEAIESEEDSE